VTDTPAVRPTLDEKAQAVREGYVVLRDGKPIGGIVTVVSCFTPHITSRRLAARAWLHAPQMPRITSVRPAAWN
jgi:hypothetical protein